MNIQQWKTKSKAIFSCALVTLFVLLIQGCDQVAKTKGNPALWKHKVTGDFSQVLDSVKSALIADQFMITGEENLALGLKNNRNVFGEDKWNTIGFKDVTAVHFCSLVFNHEVFNINMDWSMLCPFKVVLYTMEQSPDEINIITLRPVYLLKYDPHPRAGEIGKKIEERIVDSLKKGASLMGG